MKQYRITAPSYAEDHIPDAAMAADDLAEIRRLAGLTEDFTPVCADAREKPSMSPVGSNISITGMEKQRIEKQLDIKAGTPEWFQLWFSRPYLTGEKPVGDAPPDTDRNPAYLIDKTGKADAHKVEKLASQLERKFRSSN